MTQLMSAGTLTSDEVGRHRMVDAGERLLPRAPELIGTARRPSRRAGASTPCGVLCR